MERAQRGDWVEIHSIILKPEERATQVPEETKKVPLELRVKGWLDEDGASAGDEVNIQTPIGRRLKGRLLAVNPPFIHDFGRPVPELLAARRELREFLASEGGSR